MTPLDTALVRGLDHKITQSLITIDNIKYNQILYKYKQWEIPTLLQQEPADIGSPFIKTINSMSYNQDSNMPNQQTIETFFSGNQRPLYKDMNESIEVLCKDFSTKYSCNNMAEIPKLKSVEEATPTSTDLITIKEFAN